MNRYKAFKYKYDYAPLLRMHFYLSNCTSKELGEKLGIKEGAMCCLMHGCGGLSKERIVKLSRMLDINIIEWCCLSDYVYERMKNDLTPYAKSIVCRYRHESYDDTVEGAIANFERKCVERRF